MRSNKDLTINEFLAAQNIKRAMIHKTNTELMTEYLRKALEELYR